MKTSNLAYLVSLYSLVSAASCATTDNIVGEKTPDDPRTTFANTAQDSRGGAPSLSSNGGGKSSSSTNTVGETTSALPTAVGGAPATSDTKTSTITSCDDYADAVEGHAVDVVIENQRSTPIYVGSRPSGDLFDFTLLHLFDSAGNSLVTEPYYPLQQTCQQIVKSHNPHGIIPLGRGPSTSRIEPHDTKTVRWNGLYYAVRDLRPSCSGTNEQDLKCLQVTTAPSGRYRVSVTASTDRTCFFESEREAGCPCLETNNCAGGTYCIGDSLDASAEFDLASTTSVTLTFAD